MGVSKDIILYKNLASPPDKKKAGVRWNNHQGVHLQHIGFLGSLQHFILRK